MPTSAHLYYEQHGKGEDLVLICGFGANSSRWHALIEPLSQKYRVLIFDNRGSGRSDSPEMPYTIAMMADDTAALLKALHIKSAHFLGHSMGSIILQHLCIAYPSLVKKAYLLASFDTLLPHATLQLDTTAKLLAANIPLPLLLETLLPWLFSTTYLGIPGNIEKALNLFLCDPYPQLPAGFAGQLAALKTFDLCPHLHTISCPTHIIAGEEDLYTPPSQSHALHTHIPGSSLKILPKTGHMIPQENPKAVLELM